jgi:rare lipoprotein A
VTTHPASGYTRLLVEPGRTLRELCTAHSTPAAVDGARHASRTGLSFCAAAISLALCACSSAPQRGGEPPRTPGGYYLDDGPLPNPPADLERVPDAQPRAEPIRAANTRPYTVMGRTYTPMTALAPYRAEGIASWYGKRYHGQATASGEIYDMYAMTAAHPILPIPSYARVTNLRTGRAVTVRINDRGPFRSDRLIDLSFTAALKLGMLGGGSTRVSVETVIPGDAPAVAAAAPPAEPPGAGSSPPTAPAAPGTYVQLGAFGLRDNAEAFARRARADLTALAPLLGVLNQGGVYRVQAGPYPDRADAQAAARRVETVLGVRPLLVTR